MSTLVCLYRVKVSTREGRFQSSDNKLPQIPLSSSKDRRLQKYNGNLAQAEIEYPRTARPEVVSFQMEPQLFFPSEYAVL